MQERRLAARIPLEIWVEEKTETGDCYFQRSGNISPGGLYLDRAVPHRPGTRISLTFTLPGSEVEINAVGEILDHHDSDGLGMGVRFVGLTPKQEREIQRFVDSQLVEEEPPK